NWHPKPSDLSPGVIKLRAQHPEKFADPESESKKGITSYLGIRHDVTLSQEGGSWRIARDSYDEPDMFGQSPDLVPGSWSAEWTGRTSNRDFHAPKPAQTEE